MRTRIDVPKAAIAGLLAVLAMVRPAPAAQEQPLPPEQAFVVTAKLKSANVVAVEIIPAKKHYLYKSKTRFALKNSPGVSIRDVVLSSGEIKDDLFFGRIEVYKGTARVDIMLDRKPSAGGMTLIAYFQGCNEALGICYPPLERSIELKFSR
ncbi:MAG: protein-disulfide reductase DsbD N-terminal domain-containing protein [Sulfuritalea sp.]|jgi:thiol:disulfide interchange protein DsbD|nr:protein-disulfide reductase DsbD N-terminal domain-containing protein [Sulfuritalea sp.]